MYIDYDKIFLEDMKQLITEEQLKELKQIAKIEKEYLNNKYSGDFLNHFLDKKANEIAFNSTRHQDKNQLEKIILANNIVFDNKKFAALINNSNFDINSLQAFLKIISYLKNKATNDTLNEKDKAYALKADIFAKNLVKYFKLQKGITNPNIIINKLNEVLSFEPELLEEKTTKHTK